MHSRFPLLSGLALVASLLAFAPGASAEEKPKDASVIYPRNAASQNASAAAAGSSSGGNLPILLLAVVAAGAGGWLMWRQRRTPAGLAGREARKLAVSETRSLGNRQYLVVADYDGKKFLLGVCPGRIDLLSKLDDHPPAADAN